MSNFVVRSPQGGDLGHLEPEILSPRVSGVLGVGRTTQAEMSRRPSWVVGGAATTRINRTPSGLPLCSTCHKELGFCPHTPIFRDRRGSRSLSGTEAPTVASAAAGSGAVVRAADTVPSALSIDARNQSGESNPVEEYLRQGTKRRRSAAHQGSLGKGKRRGLSAQPKVSTLVELSANREQH